HGIDHNLFKVYQEPKVDFELPKKYILSVGSIEPRKNLLGLLKAYALLDEKLKSEYQLVLVGFKGWENIEIMELIKQNEKSIHYLGFITDEELAQVYNLTSLFVFPSFYEGFGLPPLEAMACGSPVVCSDSSSLPEVGGDAVVYCNPQDTNDIKEKIEIVLNNTTLQNEMIDKGLQQAKKFSWEKSSKEHMRVFEELMSR
ncbi:MAG: glycosyltransferase family 4 protein, partial [Sulfurovaceae bacterium]|nr:glycosyltransferase family 4 protein [Sulfurovaceae bacterium]